MTDPARRHRRLPTVSARFLAVALLLCGMAYVTYDTHQQVQHGNAERRALTSKVVQLEQTVNALTRENRRLTNLLLRAGIDPRPQPSRPSPSPSPSPSPATSRPRAASSASATTAGPAAKPRPKPSRSPRPATASPSPTPRPSPCTVRSPLDGRCVLP